MQHVTWHVSTKRPLPDAGFVLNFIIVFQILIYSRNTKKQAELRAKKKE